MLITAWTTGVPTVVMKGNSNTQLTPFHAAPIIIVTSALQIFLNDDDVGFPALFRA